LRRWNRLRLNRVRVATLRKDLVPRLDFQLSRGST